MAPNIRVENIASELSQLSQELEDRGSQISRLEGENARLRALEREVARLRAFEEENARLRALEGENARLRAFEEDNARLRASLKAAAAAAAASNNPFPTTTTDAPGVESQSRVITTEDQRRTKDDLLDEACDVTEVEGSRNPRFVGGASGRLNNNRRMGRSFRRRDLSSDDEDPIPFPKKEKIPVLAATKNVATAGTNKRKRATESSSSSCSRLSESLSGLAVDEMRARDQSLSASDHSDSQEGEPRPAKKPCASVRRSKAPATIAQTPTKKRARPPHPYTRLGKSPFQAARRVTPPSPTRNKQPSQAFRYPGSRGSNDNNNTSRPSQPVWPKKKNQPKPPSNTTAKPAGNTSSKRTPKYAEIEPFTFKFINSYTTSPNSTGGETLEMGVHESAEMTGTMSSFWKILTALRDKWEDQAGADWAWEVQKKVKTSGRGRGRPGNGTFERFCVSRKVAKLQTKWRAGDAGFYACLDCAGAAKPCFTWAMDEDGEGGGDDGDEFSAPPDEFWCLPVHEDDRRCVDVTGREMRIWVNEGESSSDEDGSSESGSSCRAVDEYDDEDSEVTSEESSGESSEELGVESSGDEL